MNSSVPLSPPLITAALTRIETTRTTIAQNSVVLNACLVSVTSRRAALPKLDLLLLPVRASPRVTSVAAIAELLIGWGRRVFLASRVEEVGGSIKAAHG